MISWYSRILEAYPVRTEMVTSALLWFAGDILAQSLEQKDKMKQGKKIEPPVSKGNTFDQTNKMDASTVSMQPPSMDWKRASIQTAYAALVWAPLGHHWYEFLDRAALRVAKAGTKTFVGVKLALEIVALHPVALAAFFGVVGWMSGETWGEIGAQLRRDYWPSLMVEYAMWTPIDVANFAFVPVKHQLLVVNFGCLVESIMLSFIKANGFQLPGHGGDESSVEMLALAEKKGN
uniref:Peroxisomal membrane protein 2 n=1 Tax=Odontella aurita TaxID=265563 RepID=A0A7S4N135_9STRA|mmetsp:Transcript_43295/g.131754  ORF Transcript_43295/g.131754 Transcript_43295/m.131754 type:complete len:234 (+) Transcript_43295:177-878(+)